MSIKILPLILLLVAVSSVATYAQDDKAAAVIKHSVESLGGDRYLNVRSQIGKGSFSTFRDGSVVAFQKFTDIIVFPDRERTEFKGQGSRTTQVNTGLTGWVYDGDQELIKVQTEKQIADFQRGLKTSLDNLLRGYWKGQATLTYVGKRAGTLGKRNDVVKLTYNDGFTVEFEFADDGAPQKALYKRNAGEDSESKEEDRYGQFLDFDGIKAPFVIDHYTDGRQVSRINYETVEFNKPVADALFAKPASAKDAKKQ